MNEKYDMLATCRKSFRSVNVSLVLTLYAFSLAPILNY